MNQYKYRQTRLTVMIEHKRSVLARLIPEWARRFSAPTIKTPVPLLTVQHNPEDHLSIPVAEHSADDQECRDARARGQFLARQERWRELAAEIGAADSQRLTTAGGMPVADLLSFGARADVVQAVEHALNEGPVIDDAPVLDGIMALEEVLLENEGDPVITQIVAQAHIDIAWAWRGTGWATMIPHINRQRCAAHFDRAATLMKPICGLELDSPMAQAICCALLAGGHNSGREVADQYEDLIDLAPNNPRHMRALGNHLLPRWFGSYEELELEARRTAARTQDIWGAGGYAWVYFDAILLDDDACARVDVEFFLDGLRDIVATHPQQEMVNLLAAYCAVAQNNNMGLHEEADLVRVQICSTADWLIRDHLTEVHPMVWAHAAVGFDNNARVTSPTRFAARGRADALQFIADLFREEISKGFRVTFTPEGLRLELA